MGTTDHSFIKAYRGASQLTVDDSHQEPDPVLASASIMVSNASTLATQDQRQAVSHLYAAADRIRMRSKAEAVAIPGAAAAGVLSDTHRVDNSHAHSVAAPHLPTDVIRALAASSEVSDPLEVAESMSVGEATEDTLPSHGDPTRTLRIDRTHADESPASVDETPLAPEKVEEPVALNSPWRAEWEVDAMAWPETVNRLYDKAGSELSAVLRPLLGAAWRGDNVFAVTSFNRGEGATTLAMCLARLAAAFRIPVALIDGDVSQPGIGDRVGLDFHHGWNTLPTELPISEAAIHSHEDRIVVLPAMSDLGMGNQANVACHALEELSKNFELVLLDAGPMFTAAKNWFDGADSAKIHGALIVQDVRKTTSDQIQDVVSRLGVIGQDQIAIIENFRDGTAFATTCNDAGSVSAS